MHELLDRLYLGNSVLSYVISLAAFLGMSLVAYIIKKILLRRLKKLAEKTATTADNFIIATVDRKLFPLLYLGSFFLAARNLIMQPALEKTARVLFVVLFTVFCVRFLLAVVTFILEKSWCRMHRDDAQKPTFRGISAGIQVVGWGVAAVLLLDNLGVEISALIAGLGIGGVAIALASQAILGDLFSYVVIFFDRPFEVGDFINVGDFRGTVERIGIKTTRLRSLSGEQLIFSNTDLTGSRVRNYKRMERRRAVFNFGLVYTTPVTLLREIPGMVRAVIEAQPDATFDRAHFAAFGDFSLNFEVVYYVESSEYNRYMDIQQEINLRIKEQIEARGASFAFPTQTVHLAKS